MWIIFFLIFFTDEVLNVRVNEGDNGKHHLFALAFFLMLLVLGTDKRLLFDETQSILFSIRPYLFFFVFLCCWHDFVAPIRIVIHVGILDLRTYGAKNSMDMVHGNCVDFFFRSGTGTVPVLYRTYL